MASSAGAGATSDDCEGEDQEDPSSPNINTDEDLGIALQSFKIEDKPEEEQEAGELSAFRQQWRRELESTPPVSSPHREATPAPVPVPVVTEEPQTDEDQAKRIFLSGVELERSGKLYEAIQHYKRAMQILPDVETRLYEAEKLRGETPEVEEPIEVLRVENTNSDEEDMIEGEDLVVRFQRVLSRKVTLCQPAIETKEMHISWLPYEVILLILRWVISSDLDACSLERVNSVCRGLYVASREPDLWRAICVRTWGIECGTPRVHGFGSWRDMFVQRPRLHLHGCYISKTTYLRHGETAFQDSFYRPWCLVDYYRYLRFFAEGVALMWTTAEEPVTGVHQLKYRTPRPGLGVLAGYYRLVGNKVVIIVKKMHSEKKEQVHTRFRSRRKDNTEPHEQTFHLEMELRSHRSRRNFQLSWLGYSVSVRRDQWSQFDLAPGKFPPFLFSRVKSYTAEANAPLPTAHN